MLGTRQTSAAKKGMVNEEVTRITALRRTKICN